MEPQNTVQVKEIGLRECIEELRKVMIQLHKDSLVLKDTTEKISGPLCNFSELPESKPCAYMIEEIKDEITMLNCISSNYFLINNRLLSIT